MPAQKKKILLVVMDGMGDRACRELRGLTPLQYVRTPNLDWFASHGRSGLLDPISPGIRAGSDTAHLSILGYDPAETYCGRGPFEAAGLGMDLRPGDVAFRCNFATANSDMDILDRRAGRIRQPETERLAELLGGFETDGISFEVRAGTEHRAALVLRGEGISPDVSDCEPRDDTRLTECLPLSPGAERTAEAVNRFVAESYSRLRGSAVNASRRAAGLPAANILLPRGAGMFRSIEPFGEKYGMSAACVAGVGLVRGVCRACGMDAYPLPPACDGSTDSDLFAKTRCALDALGKYDFVLMNIKGGDTAGHDGNPRLKCEIIRKTDAAMGLLRSELSDDTVVAVTCDHCTPCELGDHSGDPVPVVFFDRGCVSDGTDEFSETGCARGSVGRIRGRDVMPICMDMANRSAMFGSRRR